MKPTDATRAAVRRAALEPAARLLELDAEMLLAMVKRHRARARAVVGAPATIRRQRGATR
ncbi:hypothetical protein MOJ79_07115 [Calidifontimicrobium sp. SYSU G02091]|uniref:hypothetical protein n=1 Tax=Calidifontimicrobium sp. SYSU G02091 TaxID=2926421 RepID=UPI001F535F33|nr:hypothetical protein [Calidifontimicrobium sp. SYSU G02091]MCI1191607.1 hypothetical protein [Calidifontimicrobium sp. SYSU G02091]